VNWREEPAPDACKDVGTEWVDAHRAAVLKVPSVIVPVQFNFILNPSHPDYKNLNINPQSDFTFDPRMWKPAPRSN
jgi:RES domain-containing protein